MYENNGVNMNLKKHKKMFEKVLTKIKKEYKIRAEKRTRVQVQKGRKKQ